MTGPLTLGTEIFGGLDDSVAEDHLPIPVNRDAGREGIDWASDPASECKPIGRDPFWKLAEGGRETGFRFGIGRLIVLTAIENEGLARRAHFSHDHHGSAGFVFLIED